MSMPSNLAMISMLFAKIYNNDSKPQAKRLFLFLRSQHVGLHCLN